MILPAHLHSKPPHPPEELGEWRLSMQVMLAGFFGAILSLLAFALIYFFQPEPTSAKTQNASAAPAPRHGSL